MLPDDSNLIDGFGPLPVASPASIAELAELIRCAGSSQEALYPAGGRTMLSQGHAPTRRGQIVDLRPLCTVIDYPARDMTVTVQAGIRIAALQALLAGENQRLPIDIPRPELATLGGAMAVNVSGSRRRGWGTLRDYVIGISTLNDLGQETKAGGRVVKNVAGYDFCKLHIGALGTLGIITQVTLKVLPRPEAAALLALGCGDEGLEALLDTFHKTRTRPVSIDVLSQTTALRLTTETGIALPEANWVAVVGFEGSDPTVSWQVKQLLTEAATNCLGVEAWVGRPSEPLWNGLAELSLDPAAALSFKANLLPGAVAAFCRAAAELPEAPALFAQAGSGIVYGHFAELAAERAIQVVPQLLEVAVAARGNLMVTRCPPAWKAQLPIWGKARGDREVMREVKKAFDPRAIFNPGRFVGEI